MKTRPAPRRPSRARGRIAAVTFLAVAAAAAAPLASQTPSSVPAPASVLGFEPGADFRLATYEESLEYFRALDAASDRLTLVETGRTSEGRPWFFALVSTAENLRDVERHREIARRLADPRTLDEDAARALAAEGRAIVDINGGLHASEVAGAQHTIQLAYELVAGVDDARVRRILDDVIVVLWPSLNPDGQTMVAEWYRQNVGTPYELAPLPRLYQSYIGHDNNRDAYMLNMVESRVLARTWRTWEPQIIYVHHQSSPFPTRIWLPPFAEPVAPRAPALMSRQVNTIGMAIAQTLESEGKPGATHMGTGFDAWYPGYVDYLPMLQNRVAFWTETALHAYATPRFYTLDDFPEARRDLRVESLYASPWRGGWWRLADAVDYMRVASLAVLDYAARYREDLLLNRWRSGRSVVEHYRAEPPYAWFVPTRQRDPVAAVELLRRLAFNGVEVSRLTAAVRHDGLAWPEGTWVVPMDQPFAELARQVLEPQAYPDLREYPEGPPEQPYDAAGWTLPWQMDVEVVAAQSPLPEATRAALAPVAGEALAWDADVDDAAPFDAVAGVGFDSHPVAAGLQPPPGRLSGSGGALHLDPAQNNTFAALNRAWDAGAGVRWLPGEGGGAPRWVVEGLEGGAASRLVEDLHLVAERGPARGVPVARPRIGLYRPWAPSMDEGWTRWLLERYGFQFTSVRDADLRSGGLASRYDVILLPSERASRLSDGFAPGTVPARYAGGMGAAGIRALDGFVRAGGTLVALNTAGALPVSAFHLPVRDVVAELGRERFFSSGSLLEVRADTTHPVMAGMRGRAPVFFDRGPVYQPGEAFHGRVLAAWPDEGSPLMSGYLLGEQHMRGKAAALEVEHGEGRVLLLGMRPQWRGQPFGSFRILFNAALYTGTVADAAPERPDFWTASEPVEPEPGESRGGGPPGRRGGAGTGADGSPGR